MSRTLVVGSWEFQLFGPGFWTLLIYVWVLKFCKDRNRSRVKQTLPKSLEQTETLSGKQHQGVIMSSEDPCDTSWYLQCFCWAPSPWALKMTDLGIPGPMQLVTGIWQWPTCNAPTARRQVSFSPPRSAKLPRAAFFVVDSHFPPQFRVRTPNWTNVRAREWTRW